MEQFLPIPCWSCISPRRKLLRPRHRCSSRRFGCGDQCPWRAFEDQLVARQKNLPLGTPVLPVGAQSQGLENHVPHLFLWFFCGTMQLVFCIEFFLFVLIGSKCLKEHMEGRNCHDRMKMSWVAHVVAVMLLGDVTW